MAFDDLRRAGTKVVPWHLPKPPGSLSPVEVVFGQGPVSMGLQVAVAEFHGSGAPTRESLRALHGGRLGKFIFPLVVCAVSKDRAWLYGPSADAEVLEVPLSTAERVLATALAEPGGLAARQRLAQLQQAAASGQEAGVVNRGLFASYYLRTGAPRRPDWAPAGRRSGLLLPMRHQQLIEALGFSVATDGQALLLQQSAASRAVAVLLDAGEQFDASAPRLGVSPVAYGLALAAKREVAWLVLLRGSQIRLYPARPGVGVGQKGQADTWFEMDLAVVDDEQSPLLPLVFSADALAPGGSTEQLLAESVQFAVELGARLRTRVYERIVPQLSQAVAAQLPALGVATDAAGLGLAYRLTMRILFRLLFQAYAEDRDLLPYTRSDQYRKHSLKQWAMEHTATPASEFDPASTAIWDDLKTVWKVIDNGNSGWGVPAYNGGLFGADPARHPEGRQLTRIVLHDDVLGPVLQALLVDEVESGGAGAVDFRSLSVREFGTIYEGLLESELSVAPSDLALVSVKDKGQQKEVYAPAKPGQDVAVPAGAVYFHSASGERKATGTYFTPHIVVEHLLTRSLDPVLDEHLARIAALLAAGDQSGAAEAFFDFRVADLAMGSAHFLTAAIDHMEAKMRDFLTDHPVPAITAELATLERAARAALGEDGAAVADIDTAALLRRQIARRCIYGLDINPMAVDLARLAIWITTFVPGLPMSSLDHTLVCGNSLTGVGTIGEALKVLDPASEESGQMSVRYTEAIEDALRSARDLLLDVANASEATKADVTKGVERAAKALADAEPARLLFDAVVAGRLGVVNPGMFFEAQQLQEAAASSDVQAAVQAVRPAHFPYLFPEVFLRDNPGFDVVLGNPPWEKLHVEEHNWWAIRFPGLRGLPPAAAEAAVAQYRAERPDLLVQLEAEVIAVRGMARIVAKGPYPGIGAAHLDLMAAFAWRFTHVVAHGGAIGVVLPRTAFAGSALEQWRKRLLTDGDITDLTMILNTARWCFDMEPRYTVALVSYRPGPPGAARTVALQGPYASAEAFLDGTGSDRAARFAGNDVLGWTPTAAFPLLPDERSLPVFAKLSKAPAFRDSADPWPFRAVQGDLNAAADKAHFDKDLTRPGNSAPVLTGRSFNLWDPDYGDPYARADPRVVGDYLQQRRMKQANTRTSAFHGMPAAWVRDHGTLPMHHPRIAFRDVTNRTNSRTMICALVPPEIVLVHKSPYLLRLAGTRKDEAFLLGVLSSIPFDWYTRRFVEITMSFQLLNSFPVPRPAADSPRRRRVVEIAGRLAAVDDRYTAWAVEVGVPVGSVKTQSQKQDLIEELDALVALLYGLDEEQVRVVFETFHDKWDCQAHLDAVLKHYDAWKDKAE